MGVGRSGSVGGRLAGARRIDGRLLSGGRAVFHTGSVFLSLSGSPLLRGWLSSSLLMHGHAESDRFL